MCVKTLHLGRQYRSLCRRHQGRFEQPVRRWGRVVNWRGLQPRSRRPRGQIGRWRGVRLRRSRSIDRFRGSRIGKSPKNSQNFDANFRTIVARPRTHQSKRKKRRKRKKIENDLAMVEQTNPLKRRRKPRLKECQNDQWPVTFSSLVRSARRSRMIIQAFLWLKSPKFSVSFNFSNTEVFDDFVF